MSASAESWALISTSKIKGTWNRFELEILKVVFNGEKRNMKILGFNRVYPLPFNNFRALSIVWDHRRMFLAASLWKWRVWSKLLQLCPRFVRIRLQKPTVSLASLITLKVECYFDILLYKSLKYNFLNTSSLFREG